MTRQPFHLLASQRQETLTQTEEFPALVNTVPSNICCRDCDPFVHTPHQNYKVKKGKKKEEEKMYVCRIQIYIPSTLYPLGHGIRSYYYYDTFTTTKQFRRYLALVHFPKQALITR